MKALPRASVRRNWAIGGICTLLLCLATPGAFAVTVTKTVDPPGFVSIDGCGTYCDTLPGVSFDATDFGPNSEITDVEVTITWLKTDGTCNAPGAGDPFPRETSFRLDGPGGNNVVLALPETWSGTAALPVVTTVFDQAAAAIPSGTPVSGTFLPNNGNLDAFNSLSGTSTWVLRAGDTGAGDPLCIDSYAVTVTAEPLTADLAITKTDGVTSATPGDVTTYTIVASNPGPSTAAGSTVTDTFPAACTGVTWTCVGAGGGSCTAAGSGDIADTVDLPAGGSVTYTATCNIDPAATGTLANTATIAAAGVTDPNAANNSATDSNTLQAQADLAITKTDGITSATPGDVTTYTIVASNAGPSAAPNSTVTDTFPAACTGVTWTCIGAGSGSCTAAGSGDIADTVDLPAGGSVTYTATCNIDPAATGTLANTATIAAAGVTDPNAANNSATDSNTLQAQADLAITKTDGITSATPGDVTTYTIVASNAGPSAAPNSTVTDTFPAACTGVTWTCIGAGSGSCTADGSGDIADTVDLPAGGSVTYTATCNIDPAAIGTLANTATIAAAGVTDPNAANNSASDSNSLVASADLGISKTAQGVPDPIVSGSTFTYLLSVTNDGPSTATGVVVEDALPATLDYISNDCGADFAEPVLSWAVGELDPAATVDCTLTVSVIAPGAIENTATVAAGTDDPNPSNDSASSMLGGGELADVQIELSTNGTPNPTIGDTFGVLVTVTNNGPGDAADLDISVLLPPALDPVGNTCGASEAGGTLSWNVASLASGAATDCQIDVIALTSGPGPVTAEVVAQSFDTQLANNSTALQILISVLVVPVNSPAGLLLMTLLITLIALRRLGSATGHP
jgi:uncharacterized repeat protein (TIGR01451 family)